MTPKQATSFCGISYSSWVNWRKRGADGEEPYASLLRDLDRASLVLVDKALDVMVNLLKRGDFKAAETILKAYFPERFAQRQDIRLTGWIASGLGQIKQLGLDADETREIAAFLEPMIGSDAVSEFLAAAGLGRPDTAGPDAQSPTDQEGQDEELPD